MNEQLNVLRRYNYNNLTSNAGIYCKLDYLTISFYNCSMNDILEFVNMSDVVTEMAINWFKQVRGFEYKFIFSFSGVTLEISDRYTEYISDNTLNFGIFDEIIPYIRFNASGSGLDFLRSRGINCENHFKVIPFKKKYDNFDYRFTRGDFAFDFINCYPDFMDQLISHCQNNILPSGRLPVKKMNGGISCEIKLGDKKIVNLGSSQSDRLLRIYDKRMEQSDLESNTYIKPNPYNDPESWFRIEWQTRNRFAHSLLTENISYDQILRDIFERYDFSNRDDSYANLRSSADFWHSLFDWSKVKTLIIQNAKWVQLESMPERVTRNFENLMIGTFMIYYTMRGPRGVEQACKKYLDQLYDFNPTSYKRLVAYINKINACGKDLDLDEDSPGLFNCMNRIAFKLM